MKKNIIILSGILILIIIILVIFQLTQNKQSTPTINIISPTPITNQSSETLQPKLPRFYQPEKTEQMLQTIENRPQLISSDAEAKTNLINSLQTDSDTLYTTDEFTVYYIRSGDIFQVEIKQMNIAKTKAAAVAWFISQGFTSTGVCKLPVTFYLSSQVLDQTKQNGTQFNPIAEGC